MKNSYDALELKETIRESESVRSVDASGVVPVGSDDGSGFGPLIPLVPRPRTPLTRQCIFKSRFDELFAGLRTQWGRRGEKGKPRPLSWPDGLNRKIARGIARDVARKAPGSYNETVRTFLDHKEAGK